MDIAALVGIYGPIGAAIVGAVAWAAKVYVDKILPAKRAHETRLLEAFEANTKAFLELKTTMEHRDEMERVRTEAQTAAMVEIKDQLQDVREDIAALYAKLDMPRPSRQKRERSGD